MNKNNVELVTKFRDALKNTNLSLPENLPYRFVASLQTKPFLILTGLSGSGKTKIAEAFAMWITSGYRYFEVFRKGDKIQAARSVYTINDVDRLGVLVNQSGGDSQVLLPFGLIKIWAEIIDENGFDSGTAAESIQKKVEEGSIDYSKLIHRYRTPLKTLALKYLESEKAQQRSEISDQYCIVSVGADWTNREPLLGFPNALNPGEYIKPDCGALDLIIQAERDSSRPYFLILDEMNMSHVERYFADFLSAMESTDRTIFLHSGTEPWGDVPATLKLPENLFIIGTVNIDETTYMFSPKVLDRANVIEFRVSHDEMESFFGQSQDVDLNKLRGLGASMGESFVAKANERGLSAKDLGTTLLPFFDKLQEMGFEFGYRTAAEMSRFIAIYTDMTETEGQTEEQKNEIIDAAIIQKLLPKVHGSRNKIEKVLKELGKLCLKESADNPFQIKDDNLIKYPLSYEKLKRMHTRVISDGFTSFAEA